MNTTIELNTKSTLLKVSRKLFSQAGFEQVSVRTICHEAGCNVSAVSYHFGGKEALYRACLETNGQTLQALAAQILTAPHDRTDFESKLRLFLEKFYVHLCENSDAIGMMVYEIRSAAPLATDIINKYYFDIPKKLENFLQLAKDHGIISSIINSSMISDLMLSKAYNLILFDDQTRELQDRFLQNADERNHIVEQTMLIFTGGIYAPSSIN